VIDGLNGEGASEEMQAIGLIKGEAEVTHDWIR